MSRIKYPRTPHLPWSPNSDADDIFLDDDECFSGKNVVVTPKWDGECTTLAVNYSHARSIDSGYHISRERVRALHGRIKHQIPPGWRICGENMQAKHSIEYSDLEDWFLVFNIWDEKNICLSWPDTISICETLELKTVGSFYIGEYNKDKIHKEFEKFCESSKDPVEGYVIRLYDSFSFENFPKSYAKWVRKNHVKTSEHWMTQQMIENKLKIG